MMVEGHATVVKARGSLSTWLRSSSTLIPIVSIDSGNYVGEGENGLFRLRWLRLSNGSEEHPRLGF